jgi:serine phosphatase RsbU (regulator of sigma subunit)/predicted enzyme related to lactoylglutathione lyase
MSEALSPLWNIKPETRLDRSDPYLLLQQVTLFVRDQERSLRFFVDRLGFNVALDHQEPNLGRWVMVAPPDGTARMSLVAPKPDSEEYALIGKTRQLVFLTENVEAKYCEWKERGVNFERPPETAPFGSVLTNFEDLDGNRFALIEFDQATRLVEEQRRRTEERLESERRTARELEIARQVQARLFPQRKPAMGTLEYAGACFQARHVGGDFYDFLDLGSERLGLVVGDIAGKGIAAALLIANLQANLRSQCAIAGDQPRQFLRSVNQQFCANTTDGDYATVFFAEYDDKTRRMRYANCGHLAALLVRRDGTLERLVSHTTVLGLFADWDCVLEERQLFPGDRLVLYTDGVTESFNDAGDEFGEHRLIEALPRHREESPQDLIASLLDEVRQFSPHEQQDDITLIVANCGEISQALDGGPS